MPRPSLRSINKETGTSFRRWKEVTAVVKEAKELQAEVEQYATKTLGSRLSEAEVEGSRARADISGSYGKNHTRRGSQANAGAGSCGT